LSGLADLYVFLSLIYSQKIQIMELFHKMISGFLGIPERQISSTFLWLLQSTEVLAVSKDKKPILIICSYNPAAHQTSVTISDYMDEYSKLGGQRDIVIENMNCKSFSEAPLSSAMMTQIPG